MLRRLLIRLLQSAVLAAALVTVPTGCGGRSLQRISTPAAGVTLGYDLTAGQGYVGHVRVGNTRQLAELGGTLTQSLECDVNLVVVGADKERGDILLRARFTNVDLDWEIPAVGFLNPDEFLRVAVDAVQGMEVRFNVDDSGAITNMPTPPEDLPDEVKQVIVTVLDALESAFLVVPRKPLKEGESWSEDEKRGRKGKLGRYREGKIETRFEGLFRHKQRKEDVAKLVINHKRKEIITTKEGSRENEREGRTEVLFSTSGSYLAELDGEIRDFDPKEGMTFRKVRVEWKKGEASAVTPAATQATDVQAIADPCNPDYVGPEECKDAETQTITDPCDPDYVGAEECSEAAEGTDAEAGEAKPGAGEGDDAKAGDAKAGDEKKASDQAKTGGG